MASYHGLKAERLLNVGMFAALLAVPAIALLFRRATCNPSEIWFAAGHLLGLVVGGLIGGKPGAGPHHLIPFLPVSAYLAAVLLNVKHTRNRGDATTMVAVLFLCMIVTHGPAALVQVRNVVGTAFSEDELDRRKAAEVAAIYALYPQAVMGLGGTNSYRDTYQRTQGVFSGKPISLFEVPAWMEMEKAGASTGILEAGLRKCATPWWIIPNEGAPFSIRMSYVYDREEPLFTQRFRDLFQDNFEPSSRMEFFTIWVCKPQT